MWGLFHHFSGDDVCKRQRELITYAGHVDITLGANAGRHVGHQGRVVMKVVSGVVSEVVDVVVLGNGVQIAIGPPSDRKS